MRRLKCEAHSFMARSRGVCFFAFLGEMGRRGALRSRLMWMERRMRLGGVEEVGCEGE